MLTVYIIGVVLYGLYTVFAILASDTGGSTLVKLGAGVFIVAIWPVVLTLLLIGSWLVVRAARSEAEEALIQKYRNR